MSMAMPPQAMPLAQLPRAIIPIDDGGAAFADPVAAAAAQAP